MDAPQAAAAPSEREKWQAEIGLREREIAVKEREVATKDREIELRLRDQRGGRWTNPLVLAVLAAALAATGNALVALINGSAQRELEDRRLTGQQTIEEAKAEALRILEVIKTGDPDKAAENLSFLLKAGLITDQARRLALADFLKNRNPGEGPSTPSVTVQPPGTPPNYKVPLPAHNPLQTPAANRLLELAVTELNRNVDENSSAARIAEYWKSVAQIISPSGRLPWSAVFISWLVQNSGNADSLKPSASNIALWNDAKKRGVTYVPDEKPMLPGDIVVFSRVPSGRDIKMADLRNGTVQNVPAHTGVVFSIQPDKFIAIEANVGNALHLREHKMTEQIVGFIRIVDGAAKSDEPPAANK